MQKKQNEGLSLLLIPIINNYNPIFLQIVLHDHNYQMLNLFENVDK